MLLIKPGKAYATVIKSTLRFQRYTAKEATNAKNKLYKAEINEK